MVIVIPLTLEAVGQSYLVYLVQRDIFHSEFVKVTLRSEDMIKFGQSKLVLLVNLRKI